ncbi:TetR/AcrR family transcriptional regulator [Ruania halotolerans]|uniref:TetR/AcrR family transcriptional regulator n=1 Tax=Ruania halotolerans TaxID=2897773 RepID=UPI001E3B829B|nr:TetR/AcrR family transcriptional regulator [Ruania halotolerans]UFU04877.1 TetR/AcrR family transcriptional regulator [Ruania halotolerans]
MDGSAGPSGRAERTRHRLAVCALELFERHGYDATTTAQIAAAAGVSEMTLFRHFAAKERLIADDPYDPLIAEAVAAQPATLPPLARIVAGLRGAWAALPEPETSEVRRRVRIAARTPSLAAAMHANTRATEDAIVSALAAGGVKKVPARIAAAAALAALMAALLEWAETDHGTLADAVAGALDVLDGGRS